MKSGPVARRLLGLCLQCLDSFQIYFRTLIDEFSFDVQQDVIRDVAFAYIDIVTDQSEVSGLARFDKILVA